MKNLSANHEKIIDQRGYIQDLITHTQIKAVTQIYSVSGAIRADHFHKQTEQYNYVAYGELTLATRASIDTKIVFTDFKAGDFFLIEKLEHHSLKFKTDSI